MGVELNEQELADIQRAVSVLSKLESEVNSISFPDVQVYDTDGSPIGMFHSTDDCVWVFVASDQMGGR